MVTAMRHVLRAGIQRHHRVATRHEKLAITFLGFVQSAAVPDWLTHGV